MGTTYTLIDKGGVAIELDEMSGRVGVVCNTTETFPSGTLKALVGTETMHEAEMAYGPRVLDDNDLIEMALRTLQVACYISADPDTVRQRLLARMKDDLYLGEQ
jgi:hypothetical protein